MSEPSTNSPHSEVADAFIAQAREFLSNDYIPKIQKCLESLSDDDVWWRANEESNSIGNLMLHLSGNIRQWIVSGLGGVADERIRQAEFDARSAMSKADLFSRLSESVGQVDAVLAQFDVNTLLKRYQIQDCDVTALEAIFHVVEHFSMHTGQIILLTKLLAKKDLRFYDL
jgi:uncharacterized damage-inducible protein DinB